MQLAYIDATGLHLPDYPAVLDLLKNQFRAVFGADVYLEPDSQEGQMISIFALALHDAYSLAGSVYNAYSPATAQGAGLSRMVTINGLRRDKAGYSTAGLDVVGEAGTVITGGMAEDVAGRRWRLPASVVVPLAGVVSVTATAVETGDIRAASGEIIKIATPCRGWQRVTNPLAAVPGAPVEKDAPLRKRQAISTALPSRTVFEGTLGAVGTVPGVTRWRGYENDTSLPDINGQPQHSICVVVEGGDNTAIAEAIAIKKAPGCNTIGDVHVLTRDKYGVPKGINFYRPLPVRVRVTLTIRAMPGYLSTTGLRMRQNVAAYISSLPIGDDVLVSRLLSPTNAADDQGAKTFDVIELRVAEGEGEAQAGNIEVAYNAAALCALEDVVLLERPDA